MSMTFINRKIIENRKVGNGAVGYNIHNDIFTTQAKSLKSCS